MKNRENETNTAKEPAEALDVKVCPRCGNAYTGAPALSRADNQTLICSDCGTREALESIGVCEKEQELILQIIHRGAGRV